MYNHDDISDLFENIEDYIADAPTAAAATIIFSNVAIEYACGPFGGRFLDKQSQQHKQQRQQQRGQTTRLLNPNVDQVGVDNPRSANVVQNDDGDDGQEIGIRPTDEETGFDGDGSGCGISGDGGMCALWFHSFLSCFDSKIEII